MYTLAEPTKVSFTDDSMSVSLDDGRTITVPLAWFPRLIHATEAERNEVELSPSGLHWDALDEDISVEGLLFGRGDTSYPPLRAA